MTIVSRVSQHGTELSVTRRTARSSNTQGVSIIFIVIPVKSASSMSATLWLPIQISTVGRNFMPACLIRGDETPSGAMLKSFL